MDISSRFFRAKFVKTIKQHNMVANLKQTRHITYTLVILALLVTGSNSATQTNKCTNDTNWYKNKFAFVSVYYFVLVYVPVYENNVYDLLNNVYEIQDVF